MTVRALAAMAGTLLFCGCQNGDPLSLPFVDAGPRDAELERDAGLLDAQPDSDASTTDEGAGDRELADLGPPPAEGRVEVVVEATSIWSYPRTGLQVIFHSAEGEVLTTTVTDVHGRASAVVPRHGMVTVIDESRSWRAHTKTGLEPPETVRFSRVGLPLGIEPVGQTQVVLQELPSLSFYSVDSGLSEKTGEFPRIPMSFFNEHLDPTGTANVLAVGYEGTGQPASVFTFLKDVVVTDRLFLMMPAWRSDWTPLVVDWTHVDPAATALRFYHWIGLRGRRYKVRGRQRGPGDGQAGAFELELPTGFGDSYSFQLTEETDRHERVLARGVPSIPSAINVDLSADNLPYIDAVELRDGDPERPLAVYLATSAARRSDIVRATFGYRASVAGSHAWYVYAEPNSMASIRLPALPSEAALHRPLTVLNTSVDLIDRSNWQDYVDARRNRPGDATSYQLRRSSMSAN